MSFLPNGFSQDVSQEIENKNYDRPAGITLLALLFGIGGAAGLLFQLANFNNLNNIDPEWGIMSTLLQISLAIIGLTGVGAAVGMWMGKKWGWWLALFYAAYAVYRSGYALITLYTTFRDIPEAADQLGSYYFKYGWRVLWNGFLLFYLCRESVGLYFRNETTNKWLALAKVFGISILIYALMSAVQ